MFLPLGDDVNNRTFPLAGSILVAANALVFIYMVRLALSAPDPKALLAFVDRWALVPADLPRGHLTGLVSYIFLHAGLIHLAGNMVVLWAFIHTLESALGTACCIGFFIVWGAAGGLLYSVMNWGATTPMIGASGAVAGLIGAYFVAFGPLTKIRTFIWFGLPPVHVPAAAFIGFWVVTQLHGLATAEQAGGGIAWYAHIGGFVAGYATMFCVRNHTAQKLVEENNGRLRMEAVETETGHEEANAELEEAPQECPHCGTPLDEQCRMADTLMRCGNPDCERLIYLEEVPSLPTR